MAYYGETRRDKIVVEVRTARRANGEEQQNIVRYLHNRVIALELNRVQLSVRGAALCIVWNKERAIDIIPYGRTGDCARSASSSLSSATVSSHLVRVISARCSKNREEPSVLRVRIQKWKKPDSVIVPDCV